MPKLANRAKMTTATSGTGIITLGSAAGGFQSFADAGISDGDVIRYVIEDGNNWEIGEGTYTASGTTLSRTVLESSNADAAINLSGSAVVFITAVAEDLKGKKHLWIPANAMTPRTSAGAASGTTETSTNKVMSDTYDFDKDADEHVQFAMMMPKSWDEGTLIAQFVWSHPSTTTNFGVAWFIQAVAFANDDALDTAFGTAIETDDTGGTTDDVYISPESAAITVAGSPATEEYVVFQVYRDVSDVFDDLAVDARLLGVKIHYTTVSLVDE